MLAPSKIPQDYFHWNQRHGAPKGHFREKRRLLKPYVSTDQWLKWAGPFSLQGNSSTRTFEYPWAYHAGNLNPGMEVLEIGGGLSGFQFVLNQTGCKVTNVDPGMESHGWPCNPEMMNKLNKLFKTDVILVNDSIENAQLPKNYYDRAFSISVLEHLSPDSLKSTLSNLHECLKPNGLLILTVDLFLNLHPFTNRKSNEYGQNQNIRDIINESELSLEVGNPNELFGFPEFNEQQILTNLEKYLLGTYPVLTQCLVLRKSKSIPQ